MHDGEHPDGLTRCSTVSSNSEVWKRVGEIWKRVDDWSNANWMLYGGAERNESGNVEDRDDVRQLG